LIQTGRAHGYAMKILEAVNAVNADQAQRYVEKISTHFNGNLKGKHFAVWGLAFKPRTNDMRDAPAITIIERLLPQNYC
jgi:UDPglucose 6-dehydrogenase